MEQELPEAKNRDDPTLQVEVEKDELGIPQPPSWLTNLTKTKLWSVIPDKQVDIQHMQPDFAGLVSKLVAKTKHNIGVAQNRGPDRASTSKRRSTVSHDQFNFSKAVLDVIGVDTSVNIQEVDNEGKPTPLQSEQSTRKTKKSPQKKVLDPETKEFVVDEFGAVDCEFFDDEADEEEIEDENYDENQADLGDYDENCDENFDESEHYDGGNGNEEEYYEEDNCENYGDNGQNYNESPGSFPRSQFGGNNQDYHEPPHQFPRRQGGDVPFLKGKYPPPPPPPPKSYGDHRPSYPLNDFEENNDRPIPAFGFGNSGQRQGDNFDDGFHDEVPGPSFRPRVHGPRGVFSDCGPRFGGPRFPGPVGPRMPGLPGGPRFDWSPRGNFNNEPNFRPRPGFNGDDFGRLRGNRGPRFGIGNFGHQRPGFNEGLGPDPEWDQGYNEEGDFGPGPGLGRGRRLLSNLPFGPSDLPGDNGGPPFPGQNVGPRGQAFGLSEDIPYNGPGHPKPLLSLLTAPTPDFQAPRAARPPEYPSKLRGKAGYPLTKPRFIIPTRPAPKAKKNKNKNPSQPPKKIKKNRWSNVEEELEEAEVEEDEEVVEDESHPDLMSLQYNEPEAEMVAETPEPVIIDYSTHPGQEKLDRWFRLKAMELTPAETKQSRVRRLAVREARSLLTEAHKLVESLERQQDLDPDGPEANDTKEKLDAVMMFLSNDSINDLSMRIRDRKRKRCNRRARERAEKVAAEERRESLHARIDADLQAEQDRLKHIERERQMRKNADKILCEVKKKLNGCTKAINVLTNLKKLREIRKKDAESKGYEVPAECDKKFGSRVKETLDMLGRQLRLYMAEEQTLQVMLDTENREKRVAARDAWRERENKRRLKQRKRLLTALFGEEYCGGADDPLFPFYMYYTHAERDFQTFLQTRAEWDVYLVPDGSVYGSSVPPGWLQPPQPANQVWASALGT